ncbi:hypothetical protein HK104_001544 [Borealophlyctis nickersoniae]|nr:hypothetical protein HK104_001544 [Borealophlyctis nickersoniae]
MSLTPPDELKFVNTYLQRAAELQTKEPIVAYYCKFYAAKLAIDKNAKSKDAQLFLLNLMDDLEKEKKVLGTSEAITNDVVGYAHIENFALKIFYNADNEDRNGNGSKKTAKTFLAASIFLELLKVFGEVDAEVQEKIRYAKWKAADIIKAIKEGRTPTPGPPGGDAQTKETGPTSSTPGAFPWPAAGSSETPESSYPGHGYAPTDPYAQLPPPQTSSLSSPSNQSFPQIPHASAHQPTSPTAPPAGRFSYTSGSAPPNYPSGSTPSSPPSKSVTGLAKADQTPYGDAGDPYQEAFQIDHKAVQAAQKHSRFAISALQYDDVKTAIQNLEQALELLRPWENIARKH